MRATNVMMRRPSPSPGHDAYLSCNHYASMLHSSADRADTQYASRPTHATGPKHTKAAAHEEAAITQRLYVGSMSPDHQMCKTYTLTQ